VGGALRREGEQGESGAESAQTNRKDRSGDARVVVASRADERKSGRDVLEIAHVSKSYGDKRVLEDVSLVVRRGERVAIIGANGLGKSTLLKIATSNLEADSGTVKWGHETHVGYFAQDHHEALVDAEETPLDVVWKAVPTAETTFVRGQLGRVLFSGSDVTKKVGALSGGEAARLVFCRIMVQKPNVLVLDEPTNHLDVESIDALVAALLAFEEGTLLFVSHDRAFVSALATRVIEVTADGVRDFPGTYDEYLAKCGDDHLDAQAVVLKAKKEKGATEKDTTSYEEKKKRANRLKQLPVRRDQVVAKIDAAEARKAEIHAMWSERDFYEKTPNARIEEIAEEEKALGAQIEALLAEWEALEAELAALGG
jgi:ABC-type multidrug transport system ATPase subunit